MKILRMPEARFANLADYLFVPRYYEVAAGLRLHYVDEGPRDGRPVLMLFERAREPRFALWKALPPVIFQLTICCYK